GKILFGQLVIILFETFLAHHDLTPDLYLLNSIIREWSREGDGTNLFKVDGYFVPFNPITPGSTSSQYIIFINQRNTSPIKFWFDAILQFFQSAKFLRLPVPIHQVICIV